MKPITIYNDNLLDSVSWFMKIDGISLFPFIILRERYKTGDTWWVVRGGKMVNHETIHFQQAIELGVIPFYILYILEYIIKSVLYFSIEKAYKNISFEREAYENEYNLKYLKQRKRYNWIKRIIK
jgi:hypothetical protein